MYQLSSVKVSSISYVGNLVLLDDLGRVRSHITSGVGQRQRFDFGCNLVVTRKVMMGIYP
jgi:hypothetical protein